MRRTLSVFLASLLVFLLLVEAKAHAAGVPSIRFEEDLVLGNDSDQLIGHAADVVVDSKGYIYLGDLGFQHIQKYSPEGDLVDEFGSVGEGPGELMFPFSLGIDEHDRLYFAGNGGRVTVWNTHGDFLWEFHRKHPDGFARSIRVGKNGRIIPSPSETGQLLR